MEITRTHMTYQYTTWYLNEQGTMSVVELLNYVVNSLSIPEQLAKDVINNLVKATIIVYNKELKTVAMPDYSHYPEFK